MLRPKLITGILLALLALGCGEDDPAGPGTSTDPVTSIMNAADKASHSTYWHISLGSTTGTSDWAFFSDGTGTYYQSFLAPNGMDFTWTKLGPDALLVTLNVQTFKNFSSINGSFSSGTFTAVLDGNPTARTFVLQSGTL